MNPTPYRDRWLITVGSVLTGFFFVTIGMDAPLFSLLSRPTYLRDVAGASLMTAAVWLVVRAATVGLDRRYDWFSQPARRVAGQLILGVGGPVLVSVGLAMLYFRFVVGQSIADSTYPVYEFPISVLFIGGFNLFYVGWYLYRKATAPALPLPEPDELPHPSKPNPAQFLRKTLIVSSGLRNVPVLIDEVAYIYIDEAAVFLTTVSGNKYVVNTSLDELARDLPGDVFFRVNRQFIVHRRACSSYLNDTYGKLKVEVRPSLAKDIIVSQQKTPEFKKWLEAGF